MTPSRARGRQALLVIGAAMLALLPFLLYVWSHVTLVTIGYRIEERLERAEDLARENRGLRLRRARLESLPTIETRARRLGLAPLAPTRLLVLTDHQPHRAVPAGSEPAREDRP